MILLMSLTTLPRESISLVQLRRRRDSFLVPNWTCSRFQIYLHQQIKLTDYCTWDCRHGLYKWKKNPFLCLKISSIYMIAIDSVPKKSQYYKKNAKFGTQITLQVTIYNILQWIHQNSMGTVTIIVDKKSFMFNLKPVFSKQT